MILTRLAVITAALSIAATPLYAADDVLERIRQLEQQIQELKQLKDQQAVTTVKYDDCMQAFGREKFCRCISTTLPRETSFEQYVHAVLTRNHQPGNSAVTEQRMAFETATAAREACVEKGFFK